MHCPHFSNGERNCKEICKNVLHLIDNEICTSDTHQKCPYYQIIEQPNRLCEFILKCNENDFAFSLELQDMITIANTYCLHQENKKTCARYKYFKKEETPHPRLLPDNTLLPIQ